MIQKFAKHGCVTNVTIGDFDRPHFKRLLIDANLYLTLNAAFGAFVLAWVPLALTFGLDLRAIHKKVQWPCRTAIRQAHVQCLLKAT